MKINKTHKTYNPSYFQKEMSKEIYSHSKLSTFEQCPLKYKFKYIDKIQPITEETIESHLGKTVHSTLEWLYNQVKKGIIPSLDETIIFYSEEWTEKYSDKFLIVKSGLTEKDYYNKGIKFIIDYYFKHTPFSDNTIALEKRILFHLDNNKQFLIQGYVDRLVYSKENDEYEIHDYKTSSSMPTQEKIESDRQLSLYSLAIKNSYNHHKPVRQVWHYLAFNKLIEVRKSDELINKLKFQTLKLIEDIQSAKMFPAIISPLCHWCEFKPICPAWKNKNNPQDELWRSDKQINLVKFFKRD